MKHITGTFFDIIHHNPGESAYWHDMVLAYRNVEWLTFMRHMKESGLDTVILICTVSRWKSVFPNHPFMPSYELPNEFDPLEAALAGADETGLDFCMGLGYQEQYPHEVIYSPEAVKRTVKLAETLLARYGHHVSLKQWYIADEFGYNESGCFNPDPVAFVADVSAELAQLTPQMLRIISPYFHTRCRLPEPDKLIPQFERMNLHAICTQNGANRPDITEEHFVNLKKAFDRVSAKFWGNVELFGFERTEENSKDRYVPLIPGPFERIMEQIAWIEPYAEKLISYQFMGLMNKIGLGKQPQAAELWKKYMAKCGIREKYHAVE